MKIRIRTGEFDAVMVGADNDDEIRSVCGDAIQSIGISPMGVKRAVFFKGTYSDQETCIEGNYLVRAGGKLIQVDTLTFDLMYERAE